MEFKRPACASLYPLVYDSFKVKCGDNDEEEFMIQDLSEEFFDEAVKVIVENHAKGAVFNKAANTLSSEEGFVRVAEMYRNVFKEKISLVCLRMATMEIVGCNAMTAKTRSDIKILEVSF